MIWIFGCGLLIGMFITAMLFVLISLIF
ncbi:hypothetical protein NIGALANA_17 [Bacillus phage Nigalana]|uniref:Uncharacterized protein n=3 Tax=Wphvirus megatron TaxID=1987728 RepID=A0A1B1PBJ0_9CAUD|nr:hypothetical protein QLX47_gp019 [Bacillus phage Eyuki]YP_009280821.1 hypothetical protein SAGEFAYGE_18 [Bacillus phage SageFayge]YP_009282409.1 hypothetical protein BI005_gp017 [Bacillus phage Nigalana]YP_009284959.1 hypothetical protein BIZ88_gp017 [Bacillus phage DirtyBetty]YP_009286893.1 hypothetical protein BI006_gp017 [Bacillus phage Nemo]AOZ62264.1 hypothetical protein SBP8a_14 [Bacillus phage SBP8a]ASR78499.1 hypothetical protein BUBS_17 [Bacillus phage Bubs]ASR79330.1 hypothetica